MFKKFTPVALVAFSLALPTAAHALDSAEYIEATSAVLDAGLAAEQIHQLHNVPSVGVISVADGYRTRLGNYDNSVEMIASQNSHWVGKLRHELAANRVTRAAMAEHGVDVNRVDGVSIGSTGSLRFFVE
ncbi:MAG: hypothetical protein ABI230_06325 [Aestuariivirga sp.]